MCRRPHRRGDLRQQRNWARVAHHWSSTAIPVPVRPVSDFSLTFLVVGAALLALPQLDRNDNRVRFALFSVCIVLTWRYVGWRFATTLPPLTLRPDSLYPWLFATIEGLANLGWTIGFLTLARTRDRTSEVNAHRGWLQSRVS